MPDPVETRPLPRNPTLLLSRLGYGTATQGGLFHEVSEADAAAVFGSVWEQGLRYFDTAPWYGYGQAEARIGTFLAGKSGYVVSTKVGRLLREVPPHPSQLEADGERSFKTPSPLNVVYDYSYDGFMHSFEDSLERLGLSRVDIAYIHDPDVTGVSVKEVMNGGYRALHELREQGVLKAVGVGMNSWEQPLEFARAGDFDIFLLAGRYTLLEQGALPFMDLCAQKGIGVVVGGVYNSGLLADPKPGALYDYAPVPPAVLERVWALRAVCDAYGVPLKAAALQFPLAHPAVVSVLTAARSIPHVDDNVAMFRRTIPPALWQDLISAGLLGDGTPVAS